MPDHIATCQEFLHANSSTEQLACAPGTAIDGAAPDPSVRHAEPLVGQTVRVLATGEVGDVTATAWLTDRALYQVQWLAPDPKEPGKQHKVTAYAYAEHLEVVRDRTATARPIPRRGVPPTVNRRA